MTSTETLSQLKEARDIIHQLCDVLNMQIDVYFGHTPMVPAQLHATAQRAVHRAEKFLDVQVQEELK